MKCNIKVLVLLTVIHAGACAAPFYFSWSGLVLLPIGMFICGGLGITIGFHRLLSHRSFACDLWFEKLLVYLGVLSLVDTPLGFVATHRKHHRFSDVEQDPHSPKQSMIWGHMGWLLQDQTVSARTEDSFNYAKDLARIAWYRRWESFVTYLAVYITHGLIVFAVGASLGGLQLGVSWLIWAVLLRTVLVWHITWSVNSFSHLFGYRNYATKDASKNCWPVALLSQGEWHNNHHAYPSSACMGHRWFEFDAGYRTLLIFRRMGLVWDIKVGVKGLDTLQ